MSGDLISIVEAAYDLELDTEAWLAQLLERAAPRLDRGLGLLAWVVDLRNPSAPQSVVNRGMSDGLLCAIRSLVNALPETQRELHATVQPFGTSTQVLGLSEAQARVYQPYVERYHPHGVHDAIGLMATDPEGRVILLSAAMPDLRRPSSREVAIWSQVAAHVEAGSRLRHNLAQRPDCPPDAVVSPDGAVLHAEGAAKAGTAREHLRTAARAVDRARSGVRRGDEALELWQGLVAGEWSLVDHFDTDGRRYLVARKNDPQVPEPRALTMRERQVLAYTALGHPLKLIAYTLGLSIATVAEQRQRAMRKLGLKSSAEVIRLFDRRPPSTAS